MSVCSLPSDTFCWITVKCYNAYTMILHLTLYKMTFFFLKVWALYISNYWWSTLASARVCFREYDFPRVWFPWERCLYLENVTPSTWSMELDAHCACESLQKWWHFSCAQETCCCFIFFIPPFILYGHLIPSFWCLLTTVSLKNPYLSEMTQCENRIWITPLLHSTCWSNNLDKWNKLLKWRSGFFFFPYFFFFPFHSAL